ncbi:unnamed protein product [Gadus morhua 'NCC']
MAPALRHRAPQPRRAQDSARAERQALTRSVSLDSHGSLFLERVLANVLTRTNPRGTPGATFISRSSRGTGLNMVQVFHREPERMAPPPTFHPAHKDTLSDTPSQAQSRRKTSARVRSDHENLSSAPPNSPTLQVTPVAGTLPSPSFCHQTGAFPSHDTLRQKPPTPPPCKMPKPHAANDDAARATILEEPRWHEMEEEEGEECYTASRPGASSRRKKRNKQNGLPMEEENTVSSWNAKLS